MSQIIIDGNSLSASSTPFFPFSAVRVLYPDNSRISAMFYRISLLSSMIRIVLSILTEDWYNK
jgi:hypothetical protein